MTSRHRLFCRTTKTCVGDFRDIGCPFAGPRRSHATATKQTNGVTCGKESAIWPPGMKKISFYINYLVTGGGGGIRTHGTASRTTVFETAPFDHSGTPPRDIAVGSRQAPGMPPAREGRETSAATAARQQARASRQPRDDVGPGSLGPRLRRTAQPSPASPAVLGSRLARPRRSIERPVNPQEEKCPEPNRDRLPVGSSGEARPYGGLKLKRGRMR